MGMRGKKRESYRFVVFFLCLLVLVGGLWFWHGVKWPVAEDKKGLNSKIAAQFRKKIVDRAGAVLADQVSSLSVCAYHVNVPPLEQWCGKVASVLHMQCDEIRARFIATQGFVYLKHEITEAEAVGVKELGLPGIELLEILHRRYFDGPLFAHLIGFVDQRGRGLDGIEYQYDEILRDNSRTIFPLTIERDLQNVVNTVLKRQLQIFQGDRGCFIVMAIESGEILALVNVPFYEPERYWEYDREKYPNLAISAMVNASFFPMFLQWFDEKRAVLNAEGKGTNAGGNKAVNPNAVGHWNSVTLGNNHVYSPWTESEMRAMAFQQNILNDFLGLGFGQPTAIDLPGEEIGGLPTTIAGTLDSVLEQQMLATPLQVLRAFSALINRGKLVQPHIALDFTDKNKKISYWDGGVVTGSKAVPLTEELAMRLRESLSNEEGLPFIFVAPSPDRKNNIMQITALGFYPHHAPVVSYIFVIDGVQRLPEQYFQLLKPLKDVAAKAARFPLDG